MKEIPLGGGHVALVDDDDFERVASVGKWHSHQSLNTVYAIRHFKKPDGRWSPRPMHGFITDWKLVDHINRNGLDNRRANLRPATPSQNQANRCVRRDSHSAFKGVSWYPDRNRWRARITVDQKIRSLGYYTTAEEAARAYDAAALNAFGEYARLNLPEEWQA